MSRDHPLMVSHSGIRGIVGGSLGGAGDGFEVEGHGGKVESPGAGAMGRPDGGCG